MLFSYQQCWEGACGWINPAANRLQNKLFLPWAATCKDYFWVSPWHRGEKIEFLGNFLCLKIHQRKSRKQMFKNKKIAAINIFKTNNLKLPLASIQEYLQLLWPTGRGLSQLRFVTTSRGKMDHLHALTQFFLLYRHAPEIKLLQVFCWRYLTLNIQRQWLLALLNISAWNFRCWSLEQRNEHTL